MDVSQGVLLSLIFLLPLLHIWYRMMKSPFVCKYPTSRTSSLYVFPLMCLREPFSNPILHRATAKASSVDSLVWTSTFLGHLKNPVMTKRWLGASSVSGGKSDEKFPTPSSIPGTEPLTSSPAPREPRTEAVVVLAEGIILILISFAHA